MFKTKKVLIAAVMLTAFVPGLFAGQLDMLLDKLVEKNVISGGEARQLSIESQEAARADLAAAKISTLPYWIQNMAIKGDLRLRHQTDWASNSSVQRTRERLRLRLGFETRAEENLKAGFGLATGSEGTSGTSIIDSEPTSTNHTFSNGFGKAVLMVDYAYLEYSPYSWIKITGGKMKSGAHVWQASDLKWDTDINPDGAALTANRDFGIVNAFLTGSWLTFAELNSATLNNPDAYIIQPGFKVLIGENYSVKAAVAMEQLNVNGKNTIYYGTPAFDYKCVNPSVELSANDLLGYYVSVFSDMISNTDSKPTSDTNGSLYGIKFGDKKVQAFGDWQASYMQRRLEKNAWLSKLGDSDAYGGALNSCGYEAALSLGLTKSATLNLDYYAMDNITGASIPKSLLQCDIVYKF